MGKRAAGAKGNAGTKGNGRPTAAAKRGAGVIPCDDCPDVFEELEQSADGANHIDPQISQRGADGGGWWTVENPVPDEGRRADQQRLVNTRAHLQVIAEDVLAEAMAHGGLVAGEAMELVRSFDGPIGILDRLIGRCL